MANSDVTETDRGILQERLRIFTELVAGKTTRYKTAFLLTYFMELIAMNPHMHNDTAPMTEEKNRAIRAAQVLDELMAEFEERDKEAVNQVMAEFRESDEDDWPEEIAKKDIIH